MLYRRKLWIYTIATLQRNSCSNHPLSANSSHKFESSRVFSCSSFRPRESKVSKSYSYCYGMTFRDSGKSFCSLNENPSKCWHCGAVAASKPFLSCESCRTVQPVFPSVDYFQIYGLEKGYEIEDNSLERKYKDWQKKLHPDLVHTKSEKEKEYAAEQSARVIDAYRTLKKPLSRAIYLLSLEGVHVDEERTVSDPELLAEIMEIREAVEEAVTSQALKQIQNEVQGKLRNWSISFCNAFKNRKFEDAVTSIQRMTYYDRINEEIVKKL